MVTVKKWPRRQNVDSNRGNVTVTMWHRLREMRHKSIVYFYHLKKGTKHVFTATGLTDDRCCSLHPPELKSEWGSSSFISCCGSLSSSASSRWFCSRTWTLCISWHRLVCPVAGPSSSFAVRLLYSASRKTTTKVDETVWGESENTKREKSLLPVCEASEGGIFLDLFFYFQDLWPLRAGWIVIVLLLGRR